MALSGRTPTKKEREWMNFITQLGCCVCKRQFDVFSPAEVHHLEGKTKPLAHLETIPLCFLHHRGGAENENHVSRHPFKKKFEQRYGSELELLEYTRALRKKNREHNKGGVGQIEHITAADKAGRC